MSPIPHAFGRAGATAVVSVALLSCGSPKHDEPTASRRIETIEEMVRRLGRGEPNLGRPEASGRSNGSGRAEGSPPPAQEVAGRAFILRAILARELFSGTTVADAQQLHTIAESEARRIAEGLVHASAWGFATPAEKQFFIASPASPTQPPIPIEGDPIEAIAVLLWALGQTDRLPAFDRAVPPGGPLLDLIPHPHDGAGGARFISDATLRPTAELRTARDAAEVWVLRSQCEQVIRKRSFPQGDALDQQVRDLKAKARELGAPIGPIRDGEGYFRELIAFVAWHAHKKGLTPAPIDGDLPVRGQSYAGAAKSHARLAKIAQDRERTLAWIVGERSALFDPTPPDAR